MSFRRLYDEQFSTFIYVLKDFSMEIVWKLLDKFVLTLLCHAYVVMHIFYSTYTSISTTKARNRTFCCIIHFNFS